MFVHLTLTANTHKRSTSKKPTPSASRAPATNTAALGWAERQSALQCAAGAPDAGDGASSGVSNTRRQLGGGGGGGWMKNYCIRVVRRGAGLLEGVVIEKKTEEECEQIVRHLHLHAFSLP